MEINLGNDPASAGLRDAVHVAVISVNANEVLLPGQRVGLVGDGLFGSGVRVIGLVDPFRTSAVMKGDPFWLFLLPGTVTGMTHHWSHPDFEVSTVQKPIESKAMDVIKKTAEICGLTAERLLERADEFNEWGDHELDNSERYKDADWEAFWIAWEEVRGVKKRGSHWAPFTCSC